MRAKVLRERDRILKAAGFRDLETGTGELLTHEYGSRSQDAQDLTLSAEMRDAALAILEHPAIRGRHRVVWRMYVNGAEFKDIAARVKCSFTTVYRIIDDVQRVMLHPEKYMPPKRKPGRPRKTVKRQQRDPIVPSLPEPGPFVESPFVDIEATLQAGVENAHRKIMEIRSKPFLDPGDVADNERATHTLLAVRKSELEYLKTRGPQLVPKTDDEVKAQIAQSVDKLVRPAGAGNGENP